MVDSFLPDEHRFVQRQGVRGSLVTPGKSITSPDYGGVDYAALSYTECPWSQQLSKNMLITASYFWAQMGRNVRSLGEWLDWYRDVVTSAKDPSTPLRRFDNLSHWGRRLRDLDVTEFEEVLGDLATRWPFLSL